VTKTLTIRGGGTYAAFQSAFVATWPKLRAFLFVDDHVYWKEGGGELEPGDVVGDAHYEVTLRGDQNDTAAHAIVLREFKVNLELRRMERNELKLLGNEHLDDVGL
jgi:hypothetical protein